MVVSKGRGSVPAARMCELRATGTLPLPCGGEIQATRTLPLPRGVFFCRLIWPGDSRFQFPAACHVFCRGCHRPEIQVRLRYAEGVCPVSRWKYRERVAALAKPNVCAMSSICEREVYSRVLRAAMRAFAMAFLIDSPCNSLNRLSAKARDIRRCLTTSPTEIGSSQWFEM